MRKCGYQKLPAGVVLLLNTGIPQLVPSADLPILLAQDEDSGDAALDSEGAEHDGVLIVASIYTTDTVHGSGSDVFESDTLPCREVTSCGESIGSEIFCQLDNSSSLSFQTLKLTQ